MKPAGRAAGGLLAAGCLALGGAACRPRALPPEVGGIAVVAVPAGEAVLGSRDPRAGNPPHPFRTAGYLVGRGEVTGAEYAAFLRATGRGGRAPRGTYPAAGLTRADAEAFCEWLAGVSGRRVRLPTPDEWEYAARGGIDGAPYPWGWGDPGGRARFASGAPARGGRYAPNGYGLVDAAGNVFEWCAGEAAGGQAVARGGAWPERDPALLAVARLTFLPPGYAGRDTGFRILVER